jgi:hypothetical protein
MTPGSQRDVTERLARLVERHDRLRQRVMAAAHRLRAVAAAERREALFLRDDETRATRLKGEAAFLEGEAENLQRAAEEIDDGS